jgi:hypothetical protein
MIPIEMSRQNRLDVSMVQERPYEPIQIQLYREEDRLLSRVGQTSARGKEETSFQCNLKRGRYGLFL